MITYHIVITMMELSRILFGRYILIWVCKPFRTSPTGGTISPGYDIEISQDMPLSPVELQLRANLEAVAATFAVRICAYSIDLGKLEKFTELN